MKALRNFVLLSGLIALGGCSAFTSFSEVEALNEAQAVGNPFTQALAAEYREFSNSELESMIDYPDALHFARKGLAAAAGEMVMPEPISDWNLSKSDMEELSVARGRLVVAYDLGARETAPEQSARAQAKFDCWIEQQEENWQDDISECKSQFMEAMNALEGMIQAPPPAPAEPVMEPVAQEPVIDASQPMAPENAVYLVFFNWDKHNLTAGAMNVLDAVAQEVAANPPSRIVLVGHTDTSGPRDYNQKLSYQRVKNVRDALVGRGIASDMITMESRGESELLVDTPDNIREPANRRVTISFE